MNGIPFWMPDGLASLYPSAGIAALFLFVQIQLLLLSLPFTAHALWKERSPESRRHALLMLLLFGAALAIRSLLPDHAFVHENRHGLELKVGLPLNIGIAPHQIPSAHVLLAKLFALVWPADEPMFAMDILWSSLAVVGMYALALQMFRSQVAALGAALLLLVQPVAIFMAPTEEFMVTATGAGLIGLSLLWYGFERRSPWPSIAGTLLLCTAASAREIALVLAGLVPVVCAFAPGSLRDRRGLIAVVVLVTAVFTVPRAVAIVDAATQLGDVPSYLGVPRFPFDEGGLDLRWTGWWSPFVPPALTWLAVITTLGLVVDAVRRSARRRTAIAALAMLLVVHVQGGLVASGWFPSSLRHQLFAQAMWLLPVAYWLALAASVVARWHRLAPIAVTSAVVAVGVVHLVVYPEGARPGLPMTREYQFFARVLRTLPSDGRVALLRAAEPKHHFHLPRAYFETRVPRWSIFELPPEPRGVVLPADKPLYLFVDRSCFLNMACFGDKPDCASLRGRAAMRPTRYGLALPHCAAALERFAWDEVDRLELPAPPTLHAPADLPPADPRVTVAVLRYRPGR